MTKTVTLYDKETSRIFQQLTGGDDFIAANIPEGAGVIDGAWDMSAFYVKDGEAVPSPASPVVLNGQTLENVPDNGKLYIDGVPYPLNGESVELEFPLPGTYTLRVEAFPFKDWFGSITV